MARSKIKGTNGKPRKKSSNRSKLKASVTLSAPTQGQTRGIWTKTKINDGDKSTYYAPRSGNPVNVGPGPGRPNLLRKSTQEKITQAEALRKIEAAQKKRKKK